MFGAFLSLCSSVVLVIVSMLASLFSFAVSNQSKFVELENWERNTERVYLDVMWCFYCCCTVCMCVYCRPLPSHWWWFSVSPSSDRWRLVLTLSLEIFSWQRLRCQLSEVPLLQMAELDLVTLNLHSVGTSLPSASVGLTCWTVCVCVGVRARAGGFLATRCPHLISIQTRLFLSSLFVFDCTPKVGRTPLWKWLQPFGTSITSINADWRLTI